MNSPHKGQWRGAFMFSLTCSRINAWVNNHEAGDLRRRRAHYEVIVITAKPEQSSQKWHLLMVCRTAWDMCYNFANMYNTSSKKLLQTTTQPHTGVFANVQNSYQNDFDSPNRQTTGSKMYITSLMKLCYKKRVISMIPCRDAVACKISKRLDNSNGY